MTNFGAKIQIHEKYFDYFQKLQCNNLGAKIQIFSFEMKKTYENKKWFQITIFTNFGAKVQIFFLSQQKYFFFFFSMKIHIFLDDKSF